MARPDAPGCWLFIDPGLGRREPLPALTLRSLLTPSGVPSSPSGSAGGDRAQTQPPRRGRGKHPLSRCAVPRPHALPGGCERLCFRLLETSGHKPPELSWSLLLNPAHSAPKLPPTCPPPSPQGVQSRWPLAPAASQAGWLTLSLFCHCHPEVLTSTPACNPRCGFAPNSAEGKGLRVSPCGKGPSTLPRVTARAPPEAGRRGR